MPFEGIARHPEQTGCQPSGASAFLCLGANVAAQPGVSTLPTVPGIHILCPAVTRQHKQGTSLQPQNVFLQAIKKFMVKIKERLRLNNRSIKPDGNCTREESHGQFILSH